MSAKIMVPNENPQRTRYEWLSQEIARLESRIDLHYEQRIHTQKDIINTIRKLEKMITEMNIGAQTRRSQDVAKK